MEAVKEGMVKVKDTAEFIKGAASKTAKSVSQAEYIPNLQGLLSVFLFLISAFVCFSFAFRIELLWLCFPLYFIKLSWIFTIKGNSMIIFISAHVTRKNILNYSKWVLTIIIKSSKFIDFFSTLL